MDILIVLAVRGSLLLLSTSSAGEKDHRQMLERQQRVEEEVLLRVHPQALQGELRASFTYSMGGRAEG